MILNIKTLSKVCAAQVVGNFSQCSPCGILVNPGHVSADVNKYGEEQGPSTAFADRDLSDSFSKCKDLRLKITFMSYIYKICYSNVTGKKHFRSNPHEKILTAK